VPGPGRRGAPLVELLPAARLDEGRNPEPVGGQQTLDERCQADPISGRKRLAKPPHEGNARVEPGVELTDDAAHERRMEKRHVARRHVRDLAATCKCLQACAETPSGPRPSSRSSMTSKSPGSKGSDWPRERTSTTGPPTPRATIPATRRTRVEPCHSKRASNSPSASNPPDENDPGVAVQGAESLRSGAEAVR